MLCDADAGGGDRMPDVQALLIDLDGVVRRWNARRDARAEALGPLPAGALQRAAFDPALLTPAITGAITDEVWRDRIVARLAARYPGADAQAVVRSWSASPGRVDADVLTLIRAVRAQCRVVLVTNATSRLDDDLERLGIAGDFDAIVSSCRVGAAKPAPAVFLAALDAGQTRRDRAVFVDDSETHVRAARTLGLSGHVFRGVDGLRHHLAALGIHVRAAP